MSEQIREQISAFLDGELPNSETELLLKRLTRDAELRESFGRYALIGEACRGAPQDHLSRGLTARINRAIDGEPRPSGGSAQRARARRWWHPVAGAAVAAGDLEKSDYVKWSEQVADQEKIQFIQLNGLINDKYAGLDPAQIKSQYFTPADNTHSSPAGAMLNASCVVEGIRKLQDCPLSQYLLAPTTEPTTQPH